VGWKARPTLCRLLLPFNAVGGFRPLSPPASSHIHRVASRAFCLLTSPLPLHFSSIGRYQGLSSGSTVSRVLPTTSHWPLIIHNASRLPDCVLSGQHNNTADSMPASPGRHDTTPYGRACNQCVKAKAKCTLRGDGKACERYCVQQFPPLSLISYPLSPRFIRWRSIMR
jgi:hypothetical protein